MFEPKTFLALVDGLSLKNPEALVEINYNDEFLVMAEKDFRPFKSSDTNTFKIPLDNVLGTTITTQKEIVEKSKSVIGRGVVGGLVFGPAGLLLGGMSGIGSKSKTKVDFLFIISYLSSDKEIKNVTFSIGSSAINATRNLDKKLKKKLASIKRSDQVSKILNQSEQKDFIL